MVKATFTLRHMGQCAFVLLLALALPFWGSAQTFTGAGNPQPIPVAGTGGDMCTGDLSNPNTTTSAASSTLTGTIGNEYRIESVQINLTHSFNEDLTIGLISPGGTVIVLSEDNGGSNANYTNTVFIDGAPSITTGTSPFTGVFSAQGGVMNDIFDGDDVNGDWTLTVCDDFPGDTGELLLFEITFAEINNDFCEEATEAVEGVNAGTTNGATNDSPPVCGPASTSPGVWYTFTPPSTGGYTIDLCGAPFDARLGIYRGSCNELVCVAGADDDDAGVCGGGDDPSIQLSLEGGTTYYVHVHSFGGASGDFNLNIARICDGPMAVCQDIEIIASNDDLIVVAPEDIDDGSTADCGGLALSLDITDFTCMDDGDNTVVLTATDALGGSGTCMATVTIVNTFVATEVGCISDVNVTLGDDCTARITPFMVLTGANLECAANIEITVDDTDSDIISGCGDHTYVAEVFAPIQTINEFRAPDWELNEDTGDGGCAGEFATASLSPTQIDLSIQWGSEVSATFTAPFNGDVAFNYDFDGGDAFFDFLIIDVNGTVLVNETFADAGTIAEPLLEGQTVIVRIEDDDFCGDPNNPTTVALTDFSFVSFADELLYTCWGNILAESYSANPIGCVENTATIPATFQEQRAEGTLDADSPTLVMENYSCFSDFFTPVAGDIAYELITFTAPTTDVYTFLGGSDDFGVVLSLFQGAFNPDNPCQNIVMHAGTTFVGALPTSLLTVLPNAANAARMALPLIAGRSYTLMVSTGFSGALGDYEVVAYSDGSGQLNGGFTAPAPVNFDLDLICEDVERIGFDFPQQYIVNSNGAVDAAATRNLNGWTQSELNEFLNKLDLAGRPDVITGASACGGGSVLVAFSDEVSEAGDCGNITLDRTFTLTDLANGTCSGATSTGESCVQTLTFRRLNLGDLVLPPLTSPIDCDEGFATDGEVGGPDDNPSPVAVGYPWVITATGFYDLAQSVCNIGASYSDEPRIETCAGSYNYRREWNIIDWCDPSNNFIYDQFVKVGDYDGPEITGLPDVINVSTSPFSCLANVAIPTPDVIDPNGCSSASITSYTVLAFGDAFFAGGDIEDNDVIQAPIGEHVLILCAEDDCGNETCERYTIIVTDEVEPTAVCDDELNISIGSGDIATGVEGVARIFAEDVDEGSNDNCGEVSLEIRRNFWRNNTCDPSPNRWSPWGESVDFYCCDINQEITIELRVTDEAGNQNICWQVVTPEDKLNPFCVAPEGVVLTCTELPLTFPGNIQEAYDEDFNATSLMMDATFGAATGTDNCAVDTIVERTPNVAINECGWGTISRRFEVWQLRPEGDVNGNGAIDISEVYRSSNNCTQLIEITEVHDFEIDFPEDADAECGDDPDVPTIITESEGCDVLSVNIGDPVTFAATSDECFKYSITYDVINWCLWDGEYEGFEIVRMTEDDNAPLPADRAVEGNERPVVRYNDDMGLCIDRNHNDRDGNSSLSNCESPTLPNYGRYIYTQFVKVYDFTAPEVTVGEYGGPTDNCPDLEPGQFGDDDGNCEEAVYIPFSVSDDCGLFDGDGNIAVSILSAELAPFAIDVNGDGEINALEFPATGLIDVIDNIIDNGDGTYEFTGSYPIISSAMGSNVLHAVRILLTDGCGNQVSEYIEFDVVDCKGPAPVCINGLTVTLMPTDEGGCAMAIWASDFEGSPISDCTGQGPDEFLGQPRVTKYAIYRASLVDNTPNFVPSPDDTGLVLTEEDEETTVVYVYAFDEEGNYDFCETYVLVQQHSDCGNGVGMLAGIITTEGDEAIEGVEVSVNGSEQQSMITNTDGTYSFELTLGGDYSVAPYLNANPLNGVSTFDLVLMSKHILGVQALDSPYKRIAADVNRSSSISTLDMIQLRKLILNIDTEFQNNTSWRFVNAAYVFPQVANPWAEVFPELISENNLSDDILNANFIGVKIGDVNGSAAANALAGDDRNMNGEFNFMVENSSLIAGNVYTVAFRGADMASVAGYQGTLELSGVELVDIEYGVATAEHFGLRYADRGMITTSWNGDALAEDVLFSLIVRATADVELSEAIRINDRYTAAEAYGNGNTMNVGISFVGKSTTNDVFAVYQNTPNPFEAETLIGFNLPTDAEVTLTVNDVSGRVLAVVRGDYAAGYNTINLEKSQIQGATGVLTYTISTDEFTATKTMIAVK